jgi:hypothetical protein
MRWISKIIGCVCVAWLLSVGAALGQGPSEYQLKAAFLFNFGKFIEWPADSFAKDDAPMVIGVLGNDPFHGDLEKIILNKTINQHPFVVKKLETAAEASHCQIVFISASENKKLADIFRELRGASVLTVSDTAGFIEAGGMINFVLEENKIRFEINNTAAKQAKLKISSKLLGLAVHSAQ